MTGSNFQLTETILVLFALQDALNSVGEEEHVRYLDAIEHYHSAVDQVLGLHCTSSLTSIKRRGFPCV